MIKKIESLFFPPIFEEDGADMFEEISKTIKSEATRPQQDTLRDRPAHDTEHILAEEQKPLFEVNYLPS